ncbi:RNA polymerase sigma-I factor [Desulfitobacterium metallireducens]|uniref:RNA polymerase sigma factor SigI n=1 Tax=Desulfitobacterium metallireducens DSM 15288 TaxID=871968 RepID=W0EBN0_9FIRM|nr:RNA polymerase sigma-I factor [Desulfitobacterium metallireducens]AHF08260.1 RNA polymerase sigma factor SigI [Desulfitobacterium metallireducens DSM 15288]
MPEWELGWPWQKIKDEPLVREDFLQESQPFIRHVTNQVCHRILDWGRDEELSEALIAFNEAIDHYEEERGVPFLAYARLLIKRRLIDYYRRKKSREALPLDQEDVNQAVEIHLGLNEFREREQNQERAMEIQEFAKALAQYDLKFNDLVEVSPKHRDTRETLLRVARILANDSELWDFVVKRRKIPMRSLALKSQVHPKVLERGRKFILAVAVLIANQHDFIYLREYVLPSQRG